MLIPTFAAGHLVAALFLDEGVFAPVALSDESFRLGFFDLVSDGYPLVPLNFLAALRDVRLLPTKSTADLFAFRRQTAELLVDLDRRVLCFVVTEGTFFQKIKPSAPELVLLLHMFQALERSAFEALHELSTRESASAGRIREAYRSASSRAYLGIDIVLRTVATHKMDSDAAARY